MAEEGGGQGSASGLNEDGLIARLFRPLAAGFPGAFELKDDAAVIEPPAGMDLVVTTDALIAGVHFFTNDTPNEIAYKALAVNVSDLAAKAAAPIAYSLALVLPGGTSGEWLRDFAGGLGNAQALFGIALSGGDTTVSPSGPLTIAITAFGAVPHGRMVRRGTARAGDSLYVSGTIGDAAFGLKCRRFEASVVGWPRSVLPIRNMHEFIGRYVRPEPRLALIGALRAHASAAMDISDGLVIDCGRLCTASGVDGTIEAARVPLSPEAAPLIAWDAALLEVALTGGDDYEILAAIRSGEEAAFEKAAAAAGVSVTRIGSLSPGNGRLEVLGGDGAALKFTSSGYDHFMT